MDTKLKSSLNSGIRTVVSALLACTVVTLCLFPAVSQKAQAVLKSMGAQEERELDTQFLKQLYSGCYVLFLEAAQRQPRISIWKSAARAKKGRILQKSCGNGRTAGLNSWAKSLRNTVPGSIIVLTWGTGSMRKIPVMPLNGSLRI